MAGTKAANYTNPAFAIASASPGGLSLADLQYLPQAVDNHDHSSGNGLGVMRLGNGVVPSGRVMGAQGANVASASHLTLGTDGNHFGITGSTALNLIDTTGWTAGSKISLFFVAGLTVNSNQAASGSFAAIELASNAAFVAPANSTLTLVLNGNLGAWVEFARMAF